jgi:simple sugar transport system permease protein
MKHDALSSRKLQKNDNTLLNNLVVAAVILITMAILKSSKFFSFTNFQSMAYQLPQYGLMAFAMALAMISGGIDLSIVGMANLSSMIAALMMIKLANLIPNQNLIIYVIIISCLIAILIGLLCGLLNGLLISKIGIPPILATLGSMQLFSGVSIILSKGNAINRLPPLYAKIGNYALFNIVPLPLLIFILLALSVSFMLNKSAYGIKLYMVGSNTKAAKFSGLHVDKIIIQTYCLAGILSSVSGLIMMSRLNSAKSDYGQQYTLQCLLIAILGGVNPQGGHGNISNVMIAILIFQFLSSSINMFPYFSNFYKLLIWGIVLLGVMIWNKYSKSR